MKAEIAKSKKKITIGIRIYRITKNIFIAGMIAVVALLTTGIIYEKTSEIADSRIHPPAGQIIKINGHNMHIYAKGNGKATVVFASGWGIPCPYAEYYPLYNEIAKYTRIAIYDRPGYGWSSASKNACDIDTIALEIHELLEESGEKPPYILVGHSLASLEVIRFTQMYKDEVSGIIMLDAGNPDYYSSETIADNAMSGLRLKTILSKTGIFRLLFNNSPSFYASVNAPRNNLKFLSDQLKELDKAMYLKNMVNKNKADESANMKENAQKVVFGGKLGDVPLRILTSEIEAKDAIWKSSQEAFANWSSNSKQRIVKGTNHNMHQYAPEDINNEILDLLEDIK